MIQFLVVSTKDMTYDKDAREFTVEASTLGLKVVTNPIWVQSHVTGNIRRFEGVQAHREMDIDGEILYWTWKSADGLTLTIFND